MLFLIVLTSMKISFDNLTSVADFIYFLLDKEVIKERNVIMMQYLLRSIKRPDLEMKCVEYATENKQALCYYEEVKIPGYSIFSVKRNHSGFHFLQNLSLLTT